MPATDTGTDTSPCLLGVDGCPSGWLCVRLLARDGLFQRPEAQIFETITTLLASDWGRSAERIVVDVPIGLGEDDGRGCDGVARQYLRSQRASSVFSAPRRPMLDFPTQGEANVWAAAHGNGKKIAAQGWGIVPKIREVDAVMTPTLQKRVKEGHPEVAFARLNGEGLIEKKKSAEGAQMRQRLLADVGLQDVVAVGADLRARYPHQKDFADDDFLDACVLAVTAQAIQCGDAVCLSDGQQDAKGLKMEIWG